MPYIESRRGVPVTADFSEYQSHHRSRGVVDQVIDWADRLELDCDDALRLRETCVDWAIAAGEADITPAEMIRKALISDEILTTFSRRLRRKKMVLLPLAVLRTLHKVGRLISRAAISQSGRRLY